MRKLFWFGLGFSVAAFLLTQWLWSQALILLSVCGALFFPATLLCIRHPGTRIPTAVLLGVLVGSAWILMMGETYYQPLYKLDNRVISGEILVTDYPEETAYGFQVRGSFNWEGEQYPVQIYLKTDEVVPGNLLEGTFGVQLTLPESGKASGFYLGKRILALLKPKGTPEIGTGRAGHLRFLPQRLAKRMGEILEASFPEDVAPFAKSLLLGDTGKLRYGQEAALKVSGLRHIVAVSGLHVGVLYAGIWFLAGKQRYLTALVGMPMLFLYAAVVGFSPSVCRAGLMAGLMMLSALLRAEYDGLTALAVSAVVLLAWNPFVIQNVGFQLTVLSVLGIFLFQEKLSSKFQTRWVDEKKKGLRMKLLRGAIESVSLTLSAMSLSTPVAVYHFGVVSLLSLLSNLLCLPLVTLSFYGVGVTCALGAWYLPAGKLLGWIVSLPLRLILLLAVGFSRLPLAALYTASPFTVWFLVAFYGIVLLWALLRRGKWRYYALAAGAALFLCVGLSALGPRLDECRLTVVDVGQGQCLLLQSRGQTMVVDCGGGSDAASSDRAAEILLSQSIHRVQALALTHYDRDHAGGAANLLTRMRAEYLLLPEQEGKITLTEAVQPRTVVREVLTMPLGAGLVHVYPCVSASGDHEKSLSILFESENCAILITGDLDMAGERALLKAHKLPSIDVLVVGHHGSKYSTSQELLDSVTPRAAVISVGANNRYGHPTQQVLDRLADAGCRVYRTDQQGTIIFRR